MSTWSGRRQTWYCCWTDAANEATENLAGVAMIVIWTMTRVQNLINIIGGNMDVKVSLDFASAGMYAA